MIIIKILKLKHKLLKFLKYLAFFLLGIIIFYLVYKDQDINRIKEVLTKDVNYFWIIISVFVGLFSHISRTIRWSIMIEPLGKKPGYLNTFLAVMVGYLMNLALPRMGEISRCGVLAKYEKIPFTKLVGTVAVERAIDVLILLLLLLVVVVTQFSQIIEFVANNPEVKANFEKVIFSPLLPIIFVVILAILWFLKAKIKNSKFVKKILGFVNQFTEGLRSIFYMKNKGLFIFHSFFIWFLYYVMFYSVFYAFGFTSHLMPLAGLTVFVLGSFGMVAPVQGGMGAWHFMVVEGLTLYGVQKSDGIVFALLSHGTTTLVLIVIGLVSLIMLPIVNEKAEEVEELKNIPLK